MSQPYRNIVQITVALIVVTCLQTSTARNSCPIGFKLASAKHKGEEPICYRLKGPETFADKFEDCAGNLYTPKLYFSLNITESDLVLWADYKNLYPGGPFIDWSYTETTGKMLETSNNVNNDDGFVDEESCVVIDPVTNFTASKCDEMNYRYCFVRPYPKESNMEEDGCEDLEGYWRFWSPQPSCLRAVKNVEWGTVRANWRQARDVCFKRGGFLLTKGWMYANNEIFAISGPDPMYPLGMMWNLNSTSLRYDAASSEGKEIPPTDWHFADSKITNEGKTYGALRDNFWDLVNSSHVFYDVICERPIELKHVKLNVIVDPESKLILSSNVTLDDDDFACYTDSKTYYPTKIKARYDPTTKIYVLTPKTDGYYWCVLLNSQDYHVTESNQALFIREKQSLVNYYSVKIHVKEDQKYQDLDDYVEYWQKKLEEYIYFRTSYIKVYGEIDSRDPVSVENVIKEFRVRNPALRYKQKELIYKIKIKRYMHTQTALLHVQLNPEMTPVPPGFWDDIQVEYMKPVYFCKGFDSVPMLPLGASITTSGCRTHTCVGNFIEGVQWVTTATSGCTLTSPAAYSTEVRVNSGVIIDDSMPTAGLTLKPNATENTTPVSPRNETDYYEDVSDEASTTDTSWEMTTYTWAETVTTVEPDRRPPPTTSSSTIPPTTTEVVTTSRPPTRPPPPLLPEEQLLQVMDDLENMLANDSAEIMVEDISDTFDQVDSILNADDDLDIPGNLLHLLDQLGSRIDLNGAPVASAVRGNIALLLADAQPDAPVRGIRIAARDDDLFTNEAFEIISEEVNSTFLVANETEAVVHLPESVSNSTRRISFVVFRTDRAFQNNHGHFAVNSRILSINVENITHFDGDEVIDIHLSPINEQPDRNSSRSCAYWHFFEDGTGYWSQEGCTFIRSTQEGQLDTCRCDHLTHFAEVLVPRAIFSQRNEDALEILTIIGCFMSIVGLCLVGLTAVLFRSWRREYSNKIWLQLCIAIFLMILCFTIIVFLKFDYYNIPCMLIGVALHYSLLASFCWMLVAAILSYRRLVIVFTRDASHKLLRASAFSWGAPCAVVGILLSVNPHSYAGQFEEKTPSGAFCYPSGLGLWLAVYAPIAAMLVANWTLFALIVRSVFASRSIQRHGDTNEAVRCASVSCLLVFLFGLPWIFGLFAYNVVAAYLFTLTATYQGFVLFVFFVLGNKKTRDLWLNKLKIKQTRKIPVTSSTFTHRSTGVGYRGDAEGGVTTDPNSTKPRSLSGSDNSRFS